MAQVNLWTRFGRRLSSRRGVQELEELLSRLPPGTAIEGDWLLALGVFFVSDITIVGRVTGHRDLTRIEHYRPASADHAGVEILQYSPVDWRMELFLNSDRVVAISQPNEEIKPFDLRSYGYAKRGHILKEIVAEIDHAEVRLLPAVDCDFHQAYEEWKLHDFAEGVVIKHRQSPYPSDGEPAWKRHLYEWD